MKIIIFSVAILFVAGCAGIKLKSDGYRYLENIEYKVVDAQSLTGDLYVPNTSGLKPAVVVVHGGGWTSRSGDMEGVSKKLLRAGFVVFNIRYRLAPEHRHPAQVEDVSAALAWLYENADTYQVDRLHISGWGYSAGAHLILMAGLNRQQPPFLSSIVAGGTPADLSAWPNSPLVYKLIGKGMSEAGAEWQNASPVNHVSRNSPPVFLYHGERDSLVEIEQMTYMEKALRAKNVPVETYTVKFLGHIATYVLAFGAEQRAIQFSLEHIAEKADI